MRAILSLISAENIGSGTSKVPIPAPYLFAGMARLCPRVLPQSGFGSALAVGAVIAGPLPDHLFPDRRLALKARQP